MALGKPTAKYDKFEVDRHGDYWILAGNYVVCPECSGMNIHRVVISKIVERGKTVGLKAHYDCAECGCKYSAKRLYSESCN